MNKEQRTTRGHKTFGAKWSFEHPATHQSLATEDTDAARSPKRFIVCREAMVGNRISIACCK